MGTSPEAGAVVDVSFKTMDLCYSDPNAVAMAWEETLRVLETAEVFWLSTVRADGCSHVTLTCILGYAPNGIRVLGLTPMLTPTPVNVGERPRTLDCQNGPILVPLCTSLNFPERTAAGSKNRRFELLDRHQLCPLNVPP